MTKLLAVFDVHDSEASALTAFASRTRPRGDAAGHPIAHHNSSTLLRSLSAASLRLSLSPNVIGCPKLTVMRRPLRAHNAPRCNGRLRGHSS